MYSKTIIKYALNLFVLASTSVVYTYMAVVNLYNSNYIYFILFLLPSILLATFMYIDFSNGESVLEWIYSCEDINFPINKKLNYFLYTKDNDTIMLSIVFWNMSVSLKANDLINTITNRLISNDEFVIKKNNKDYKIKLVEFNKEDDKDE